MTEETIVIEHQEELQAQLVEPVEPLVEISLWADSKERTVRISTNLLKESKMVVMEFLRANSVVFAWSHEDMSGIDPRVITQKLNIRPEVKLVIQRKRSFTQERSQEIKEEVGKLVKSKFTKEVNYPSWLANVVMVKKGKRKIGNVRGLYRSEQGLSKRLLSSLENRLPSRFNDRIPTLKLHGCLFSIQPDQDAHTRPRMHLFHNRSGDLLLLGYAL